MPNFNLTDQSGLRCIVGHLGKQPEMKYTSGGKRVAKFTMATNFKDQQGNVATTWHSINAWDEQADAAMQLRKGQVACVIGKEATREYNGKEYRDISAWFIGVAPVTTEPTGHHEQLPPKQQPADNHIPF